MNKAKTGLSGLVIILLSLSCINAQTIEFTYDPGGNRTSRTLIVEKMMQGESKSGLMSESSSEIKASDLYNSEMIVFIYPNPSSGILNIEIINMPSEAKNELSIYDLKGTQLLIKKNFGTPLEVDISSFRDGVYIMRIKINKIVSDWKIIKSN